MTSPGVVPAFNPGEYCQAGFGTGSEGFTINEFALETSEETLRHGIIKRIANRSHGRSHAHLAAAIAEGHAGVLASLIAVMNNLFGAAKLCLRSLAAARDKAQQTQTGQQHGRGFGFGD